MGDGAGGGSDSSRNRFVTGVTLLVALTVIGAVILGGPYRGATGTLVQIGLAVGAAGGGLLLRLLGLGEPLVKRPGWRWVGAGSLLYLVGVGLGLVLLTSTGGRAAWWEDFASEGVGLAVILSTPLAVGPEAEGGRS